MVRQAGKNHGKYQKVNTRYELKKWCPQCQGDTIHVGYAPFATPYDDSIEWVCRECTYQQWKKYCNEISSIKN